MPAFGKKRGRNGKRPGPPVHDDLVERDFTADTPNRLWLADITEHRTREGKLYLCAIKDVYCNRIVGYSIDSRMKSRIAVAALDSAVARRRAESAEGAACTLHTDRGSQLRSRKLVHQLNRHGMVGSMGRVGAAGDNAAMESFFSLLQKNVLNRRGWGTREDLGIAIVTLDREDLSPTPSTGRSRTIDPGRIRVDHESPPPLRRPDRNCHPFVQQTQRSSRSRKKE